MLEVIVLLYQQAACDETSEKLERAFVQLLLTSASGNNNIEVCLIDKH